MKQSLKNCHSDWIDTLKKQIIAAENGEGPTTFDEIVAIFGFKHYHPEVELILDWTQMKLKRGIQIFNSTLVY